MVNDVPTRIHEGFLRRPHICFMGIYRFRGSVGLISTVGLSPSSELALMQLHRDEAYSVQDFNEFFVNARFTRIKS